MRTILTVFFFCFFIFPSYAENPSFKCTFIETKKNKERMDIIFDNINIKDNSGRLVGSNGGSNITVFKVENKLHFLEFTQTGNLSVTSIIIDTNSENHQAIHSRNMSINNKIIPSQHAGYCKIL